MGWTRFLVPTTRVNGGSNELIVFFGKGSVFESSYPTQLHDKDLES